MKRSLLKISFMALALTILAADADAQRRNSRRGSAPPANETGNTNNTNTPAYPTNNGIPIRVDSTSGGLDTTIRRSLRSEGAFETRSDVMNQRTPLVYEHLRWDDALYAEKVWRELDLREKLNATFRYDAQEDNGNQQFISILLNAVRKGEVMAFEDDRFTQPLTLEGVQMKMNGGVGADTSNVTDVNDPSIIVERVVTPRVFNPKDVMKIRIKEEWVFDREASRMFVRIIGICPLKTVYFEGTKRERGVEPMFWLYYPDLRQTFTRFDVYNPKNMGISRMTWEELFESRMFSSYIIKSTLDNPGNRMIRGMVKDPILALLEGDNVKDRIFNFEQDLWSY